MKITIILIFWITTVNARSRSSSSSRSSSKSRSRATSTLNDNLKHDPSTETKPDSISNPISYLSSSRGEISEFERRKSKSTRKKEPQEEPNIIWILSGAKSKIMKKNFRKIDMAIKKKQNAIPKTECINCNTMRKVKTSNSFGFNENWYPRSSNMNLKISLFLIILIFV